MNHIHTFHCDHATPLVILSYTISVLGAYCALQWAALLRQARGWRLAGRLAGAAIAMGGGAIWSMHFIAMIACRLPVPVSYNVTLTLASLVVAVVVTGVGLFAVAIGPSTVVRLLAGGVFTGLGVAAMHYTGMAAMHLPAQMIYRPALVVASIAIAVIAATAALWIAFSTVRRGLQRLVSSAVMGGAVCGMHYTAMAAVTFVPTGSFPAPSQVGVMPYELGLMVFGTTLFVIGLLYVASRFGELERHAADKTTELRESEARSTAILESALDAVVMMDEHGVITAWNVQAEKIFGWPRNEAVGRLLATTIIPPTLREAHERGLRHYLATGQGPALHRRIEMTAQHRDGHEFPVELAISPAPSGGRPAFSGFIRDITERKRAEEILQGRTTYLNALIEHSPIAIIGLDSSHRVEMVNPAFERLFLYDQSELLGTNIDDFIAPMGTPAESEAADLTHRVLSGETVHVTTARRRKDGKLVDVELYGVPLTDQGRLIGVYALYHDISERRHLEEQLRQSQKLEAIGTLAGGVAHDFNNLLTTVVGYSDLLLDAMEADSPLRADLVEIKKAADQATSLTRQLLAFSRKELAVPKALDLREIVADMDNMLRRLVGEDVELVTVTEPSLGHIKADRGQIEQVLMNLVLNARDAMPAGGKLTIEGGNVDLEDTATREGFEIGPGPYVKLAVSDTGAGIDAETRGRIFEPFFTTKQKGRGTGLGLSTVYGIVKQCGGYIRVDSEPGHGASFTIWLPRIDEEISPREFRGISRSLSGRETILLVEDEESVRKLARTLLTRQGYRVLEAGDGEEAIGVATSTDEAIDLVLTDAVMPGITVGRLIADLHHMRPHAKTLIMSGYTSEVIVRRGILQSDIPFIQKPFTGNSLLGKVREVLDGT